jgi:hypothetical protein
LVICSQRETETSIQETIWLLERFMIRINRTFIKIFIYLLFLIPTASVQVTCAQDNVWNQPVNLSRSGSASSPVIVSTADGLQQAYWWDSFDGLMTSVNSTGTWPEAYSAAIRTGTLRSMPKIVADTNGWVHAFWIDTTRDNFLFHAQTKIGSRFWEDAELLAKSVHSFDLSTSTSGGLALAYMQNTSEIADAAGIYLLYSSKADYGWHLSVPVVTSRYFRNIEEGKAYFRVLDKGDGRIYLAWEDPNSGQVLFSYSTNKGDTWLEYQVIDTSENRNGIPLMSALPNTDSIWMGKNASVSDCALILESFISQGEFDNWSSPTQSFKDLDSCPGDGRFISDRGSVFWIWGEGSGKTYLSKFDQDLLQWLPPYEFSFSFEDPDTANPLQLNNQNVFIKDGRISIVGSAANGDVWVLESQLESQINTYTYTQNEQSPWAEPTSISLRSPVDGMPAMAVDEKGNTHIVWSQAPDSYSDGNVLYYTCWLSDSNTLAQPIKIVEDSNTAIAHQPDLLYSSDGWLHLAWSGGDSGQIFYRRSLPVEAASRDGWSITRPITPPGTYSSPQITSDGKGNVYIIYTKQVNENRGVYLVRSGNSGKDWSQPISIFNAEMHGWLKVDSPTLALSPDGVIYAAWTKTGSLERLSPREIDISFSTDNGQTWSEPTIIAGEGYAWPRLVYSYGKLYIFYASTGGQVYQRHQLSEGTADQSNWSLPAAVTGFKDLAAADRFTAPFSIVADGYGGNGSLHLVGNVSRNEILYSQWLGERWQTGEVYELDSSILPSGGVYAETASQGKNLSIVWISTTQDVPEESSNAQPTVRYELYHTVRDIPVQILIASSPQSTAVPTLLNDQPTATPTLFADTSISAVEPANTTQPTLVINIDSPAQTQTNLSPLLFGGAWATVALLAIFSAIFLIKKIR